MRSSLLIGCVAVFLLTGWALKDRKGTLDYQLDTDTPPAETALIRPATKAERRAPKANAAVRMFVNPGGPRLAKMLGIRATPDTEMEKLAGYGAVRVKPGTYEVTVHCETGGWWKDYEVSITAVAGDERLIECAGNTGHSMTVSVFAK